MSLSTVTSRRVTVLSDQGCNISTQSDQKRKAGTIKMASISSSLLSGMAGSALNALGSTFESEGSQGSQGSSWESGYNNGLSINRTDSSAAQAYNLGAMREANLFSAAEAQKNRDWQEYMSSSAFSRAVEDMKRAGINPILAAGAQAPMGSGGQATGVTASIGNESSGYSISEAKNAGQSQSSSWGSSSAKGYSNMAEGLSKIIEGAAKAADTAGEVGKTVAEKVIGTAEKWFNQATSGSKNIKSKQDKEDIRSHG